MTLHVYPTWEARAHVYDRNADCVCEPRIYDEGDDAHGEPARVFVHAPLRAHPQRVAYLHGAETAHAIQVARVACAGCPGDETDDV